MFDNKWQKKEMPLVSLIGMGGGLASPAFLASIVLNILKPTVFSPADDTGAPDFDYTAESSAITNVGTVGLLGGSAFDTTTYTGTSASQKLTTGLDMSDSGGLFWLKGRNNNGDHWLYDSERGSSSHLRIGQYEATNHGDSYNVDFENDGVTLGSNGSINYTGSTYVGWSFLKTPGFFDVVSWTGDGSGTRDISHSLGSEPAVMIWKKVNTTSDWSVYHKDVGLGHGLYLNTTNSKLDTSLWGTGPTTTNFPAHTAFNTAGEEYVAYLFADNPSNQIKCGTFSNNTGSWGPPAPADAVVDCGFAPQFIIAKQIDELGGWYIMDSERGWSTSGDHQVAYRNAGLQAQEINDEAPQEGNFNFNATSTGFEVTYSRPGTWVFIAIGSPQETVPATQLTLTDTTVSKISDGSLIGGTSIDQVLTVGETVQADTAISSTVTVPVFSTTLYNGNGQSRDLDTGIDNTDKSLIWFKNRDLAYPHILVDTERGANSRLTSSNAQQAHSSGDVTSFTDSGVSLDNSTGWVNHPSGHNMVAWNFRAAPGFFDIQTWTGDSVNGRQISHDLGSAPGAIIIKNYTNGVTANWEFWHNSFDADDYMGFNATNPKYENSGPWNNTLPTSEHFTVSSDMDVNRTGDNYVAYLFADTPSNGIKCGTYTGTGGSQSVDAGFTGGCAWVMVKNISSSSDWAISDSARYYGNDHLYPNNDNQEDSSANFHVNDNGFGLNGNDVKWNESGDTYIYIAIAANAEGDITTQSTASGTVSASSGNTITLSDVSGTWSTGMKILGTDSDTKDNPDPISVDDVSLTSSAPTAETNVNTWGDAVWEIATDENFTQNVQTATTALSATGTQAGPSFTLEKDTGYYARTKYSAMGQESEWSDVTYFVTKSSVYVDDVFSTYVYTGNSSTQTISNGIDLSGEGGLVWLKNRDVYSNNVLYDTERGATHWLTSDNDYAEGDPGGTWITYNSDGFTVGNNATLNYSGYDMASWTFRKSPGFFDIVTFTGNGGTQTIPHSLGTSPGMILIKNIDSAYHWTVWHRSLSTGEFLRLNTTESIKSSYQNSHVSSVSSTDFTLGGDGEVNNNNHNYVAYVFAHDDQSFGTDSDEAIIKCGSYTGTGNSSKNFINLGFEPQWLMIKNATEGSTNWVIVDVMRGFTAIDDNIPVLSANLPDAESTMGIVKPFATGFEITGNGTYTNWSGKTFIYMAIRRPHKPATVATDVFFVTEENDSSNVFDVGFPPDTVLSIGYNGSSRFFTSRLLGGSKMLESNESKVEDTYNASFDLGNKFSLNGWLGAQTILSHCFRRSPGFFDVVTYEGTGSSTNISHNLDVAPELMIVRARNRSESWPVYISSVGETGALYLNSAGDVDTGNYYWNDTAPTAEQFSLGTLNAVNHNGTKYIAYLFSTLPGISKVGSYTGTGNDINIDCEFLAGARFVMIKRTNGTGDWYIWDSARGIVSGNDPYVLLNTTGGNVTNTDYIDPLNAGFTVTSSAPAAINASGGEYMFLAIA